MGMDQWSDVSNWIFCLLNPSDRCFLSVEELLQRAGEPRVVSQIWNSPDAVQLLLHEVARVYPILTSTSPKLKTSDSNHVFLVLKLLSSLAVQRPTPPEFVRIVLPYLYQLWEGCIRTGFYEYWLQEVLGFVLNLVGGNYDVVTQFLVLVDYKVISMTLQTIETNSGRIQLQAVRILKELLMNNQCLSYVGEMYGRYVRVALVLTKAIDQMDNALFGEIIQCFLRLSDHEQARRMLNRCLPHSITDVVLYQRFPPSSPMVQCVEKLMLNLNVTGYSSHYVELRSLPSTEEQEKTEESVDSSKKA